MDYHEKAFKTKFASAGEHLGVKPDRIVSLKLRDTVSSYGQYREMLRVLEHEAGIHWSKIDGDLQGQGYLVDHEGQKIIVVEHETGLEILYIAGSIASLIGLIPIVLQCWGGICGYIAHHHAHQFRDIEICRIDGNGKVQQDHSCGLGGPSTFPLSVLNTALSAAARILDADIGALRHEVHSLGNRLAAIEKQLSPVQNNMSDKPQKQINSRVGTPKQKKKTKK